MAVTGVRAIQTFMGLDADTRPTAGVPGGSRYWVKDVGHWEIYDGAAWTREVAAVQGNPNYFNVFTAITTTDANTAVVPAVSGMRAHITDIVIISVQAAAVGKFTLTDDAGTGILLGPMAVDNATNGGVGKFVAHFKTPLVNETQNDQVEMDKTAAEDDWAVYIAGYYAP